MVTRILFDPRRDLPDGTTIANPVTITATPTGVREDGSAVVLPTSLTFTITTSADLFRLAPVAASWCWRLAVRDSVTDTLLQTRTVRVPDVASVDYQALPDVDPVSLEVTTATARQWDATFADLLDLITQISIGDGAPDAAVAALIDTPSSLTRASLSATYSTLAQLAASPDLLAVGTITRSGTGAATAFNVAWPDGSTGAFTGTESSTTPGAIDSYTVTKVKSGTTVTFTQPALTRDASGAVTNRPAMTVS